MAHKVPEITPIKAPDTKVHDKKSQEVPKILEISQRKVPETPPHEATDVAPIYATKTKVPEGLNTTIISEFVSKVHNEQSFCHICNHQFPSREQCYKTFLPYYLHFGTIS
jgi:hypothetical protein